jgi:hypothetical protein
MLLTCSSSLRISESDSSDWDDEMMLPIDEQDGILQDTCHISRCTKASVSLSLSGHTDVSYYFRVVTITGTNIKCLSLSILEGNDSYKPVNMSYVHYFNQSHITDGDNVS